MAKAKVTYDDRKLRFNVKHLDEHVAKAMTLLVDYHATAGTAYMKSTAPWTDRTGAARAGLHTVTNKGNGTWVIVFAHSVDYGIWLEVKYSGRDQVIMPTVVHVGQALMKDMDKIL